MPAGPHENISAGRNLFFHSSCGLEGKGMFFCHRKEVNVSTVHARFKGLIPKNTLGRYQNPIQLSKSHHMRKREAFDRNRAARLNLHSCREAAQFNRLYPEFRFRSTPDTIFIVRRHKYKGEMTMPLREELSRTGNFLFRWRSYLPLFMIVLILLAMPYFEYPGHSEKLDELWEIFCLIISFSGLGIRIVTIGYTPKGTSGTNTRRQIADVLNTTGMYSVTRNPLYLGNFVIWFGISMFPRLWWFSLIVVLIFWLYYERIIFAEEEFLREKFGELYFAWAKKTPVFIPNFRNWESSEMMFSFRKVLKNEYKSYFAIIVSYIVIEIIGDIFAEHKLELDTMCLVIVSVSAVFYLFVRILKKKTRVLDTE